MSFSVFAFIIIAIMAVMVLATIGYFLLYTSVINKALATKGRKHLHMMPPYKVVIASAVIFVIGTVVLGTFYLLGINRIVTAHDLEVNMRKYQAVNEEWNVEIAMSDDFAAVIAYDDNLTDHTFAVYKNANDTFTDYEYRYGGHTTSVERSVSVYKFDGTLVLISMNALHISKIECHDGDCYEIDPARPFVLIVQSGGFDVFDNKGNLIDLEQDWWYEVRKAD